LTIPCATFPSPRLKIKNAGLYLQTATYRLAGYDGMQVEDCSFFFQLKCDMHSNQSFLDYVVNGLVEAIDPNRVHLSVS
jgi:hypothetical protein